MHGMKTISCAPTACKQIRHVTAGRSPTVARHSGLRVAGADGGTSTTGVAGSDGCSSAAAVAARRLRRCTTALLVSSCHSQYPPPVLPPVSAAVALPGAAAAVVAAEVAGVAARAAGHRSGSQRLCRLGELPLGVPDFFPLPFLCPCSGISPTRATGVWTRSFSRLPVCHHPGPQPQHLGSSWGWSLAATNRTASGCCAASLALAIHHPHQQHPDWSSRGLLVLGGSLVVGLAIFTLSSGLSTCGSSDTKKGKR